MRIKLGTFGGMVPRRGEQHLDEPYAVEATNTDLDSGELRPLIEPTLAHTFGPGPQPNEPTPPGIIPPTGPDGDPGGGPPTPPGCIPVTITSKTPSGTEFIVGETSTSFEIIVNADATPPVEISWYLNGAKLVGETERTLELPTALLEQGEGLVVSPAVPLGPGYLEAYATNPCGQATVSWSELGD